MTALDIPWIALILAGVFWLLAWIDWRYMPKYPHEPTWDDLLERWKSFVFLAAALVFTIVAVFSALFIACFV